MYFIRYAIIISEVQIMIVYRLSIVKLFNSYTDREKIQSNIQIFCIKVISNRIWKIYI